MSDFVLVVVAPPAGPAPLASDLLYDLERACGSPPCELAPGRAYEFAVRAADAPRLRAFLDERLSGLAVDRALVPAAGRRRRLLVCDMDSTAITVECVDELAREAGVGERVAAITRRAMAGELVFEEALEERVRLLAGLTLAAVDRVIRERVRLAPGLRTLVATMRAHGAFCALVSGGFTEFTRVVRLLAGFDLDRANVLEVDWGVLTGRLVPPVLGREAKRATLEALARRLSLPLSATMAIGDGANDLAMIEAAGLGIGWRPQPVLAAKAGACIRHTDLTSALFFQGYGIGEFVDPGPACPVWEETAG